MAYVKQITIRKTLINSLKYITNPEKTESDLLVSGLNCSANPKLAYRQMKVTKNEYRKIDKVLGYHFIQSFKKGEISNPRIAHEIGVKWADKISNGRYEIVVATHIDKGHIHNHLVMNSVSKETGEKYNSCKEQYREIKKLSNELSEEYNLSIIESNNMDYSERAVKNMAYNIWLIKNNIEDDRLSSMKYVTNKIDEILAERKINNIDDLAARLKDFNIEVKYKNRKGELYKNISFKIIGSSQTKGFRGKYNHSLENLIKRIADPSLDEKKLLKNEWQKYASKAYPRASYKEFIKKSIDAVIESGNCNNIDDLARNLKEKYNITMDYLAKDLSVKKRIKFFANDCPYEKYAVGSYGLAGKELSSQYENDGIYYRIEKAKSMPKMEKEKNISLVKFTGDLKKDFALLKSYFEYTNDSREMTVDRCIKYLDKGNISDIEQLVAVANLNARQANSEIDEKNAIIDKIKIIEEKEKNITKLQENISDLEEKLDEFNKGIGVIKNRVKIKELKQNIAELSIKIEEEKIELSKYNRDELIYKEEKLEYSIRRRRNLQETFEDAVELFNNKEKLVKENNKETRIKQADRIVNEIKIKKRNDIEL